MKLIPLAILGLALIACQAESNKIKLTAEPEKSELATSERIAPNSFVGAAEKAHHVVGFLAKEHVRFDIQLFFGGSERLNGTITMATNSTGIKIEKKDGSSLVFDGSNSFQTPDTMPTQGARFALFTWPYFFGMPYKLSDPGTIWNDFDGSDTLNKEAFDVMKLTFEAKTGDSPDDWYVVYTERESHLIRYASYIVTLTKSVAEAESDPHAIEYGDYQVANGIPVARKWKFWGWKADSGLGDQLGEANISNVSFPEVSADFYQKPAGSALIQ